MRKKTVFLLIFILGYFLLAGCQPSQSFNSVQNVTSKANRLIGESVELLRKVDVKVEKDQLDKKIAILTTNLISNTMDQVNKAFKKNDGILIETTNKDFANFYNKNSNMIGQINEALKNNTLPDKIDNISADMKDNKLTITSNMENILMVNTSNTLLAIDKATDQSFKKISMVLLGIGILLLILILFKLSKGLNKKRILLLLLCCISISITIIIIVNPPLRGRVISQFNLAQPAAVTSQEAEIISVYPEKFILGENDTIIIYGNNLDQIKDLTIKLSNGKDMNLKLPKTARIKPGSYKIIVNNLKANNGWNQVPSIEYPHYEATLKKHLNIDNTEITNKTSDIIYNATQAWNSKDQTEPIDKIWKTSVSSEFDKALSKKYLEATSQFFNKWFNINEGDYQIGLYSGKKQLLTSQPVLFRFPIPPGPLPDITITDVKWDSPGIVNYFKPIDVTLQANTYHNHVKPFKLKLIQKSNGRQYTQTIDLSKIKNIDDDNKFKVTFDNFKPNKAGDQAFTLIVDSDNVVAELKEDNNSDTSHMEVKEYTYKAKVKVTKFYPFKSYDSGEDEYRIKVRVNLNGKNQVEKKFSINGDKGHTYDLNHQFNKVYSNLKPGDTFKFYTSGYEADADTFYDPHDDMGNDSTSIKLSNPITKNNDSFTSSFEMKADGYKVFGQINIFRKLK